MFHHGQFVRPPNVPHEDVILPVTHLQHVTTAGKAIDIASVAHDGTYAIQYNTHADKHGGLPLCFFGRMATRDDQEAVLRSYSSSSSGSGDLETVNMDDNDSEGKQEEMSAEADEEGKFAPSLLLRSSRYGYVQFSATLQALINAYGAGHEVQLRILGTTTHQKEYEHAILVCRTSMQGMITRYPLLSPTGEDNTPIYSGVSCLLWAAGALPPCSTAPWETISFAFLQPPNTNALIVRGSVMKVSFVRRTTPNIPPVIGGHGGEVVEVEEAAKRTAVRIATKLFPKRGRQRAPFVFPLSFRHVVDSVFHQGGPGLHGLDRLVDYVVGTSFADADGILCQHYMLGERFSSLQSRKYVLLGLLLANIQFQ